MRLDYFNTNIRLYLFTLLLAISGCGSSSTDTNNDNSQKLTVRSVGLNGLIVYKLEVIDGSLHAATDKGLYRQTSGNSWELLGDSSWRIIDWAVINSGHWIISTSDADPLVGNPTRYELYESLDNGKLWQKIVHNFGGEHIEQGNHEPLFKMVVENSYLYGVGFDVVAGSSDYGRNWEVIDGFWGAFSTGLRAITLSQDKTDIWYGGQGALESLVLRKHSLTQGRTLDFSLAATALLPAPSVVLAIRYSPFDEQHLLVCAEGGIIQSKNGGDDWQRFFVNNEHRFYFDVIPDSENEGHFYTAGWTKSIAPQPLIIDISHDAGKTWKKYTHSDNTIYGGVFSMTSRIENNQKVLYLGLFQGGVVRVSDLP
jgi:hypothetical protein